MSLFKIALASAATICVAFAGTAANAEPVRAAAATPGVISVKKVKAVRTTAPVSRESREVSGADIGLSILAAGAGGFALYEATKSDSTGG
ncbi:hypothetical protein AQZ52_01555 [Novosphingobium fuchskuhlense]|uniref:Uncharacterized protein n=1 Tax=Novosphingobium fuchskuhlense TaxID=1117702 RepID=A0A117UZF2_9SPHN|nr:hypothetical protein AQZ52_01555 [Novosphingobium fuchskuhlense]